MPRRCAAGDCGEITNKTRKSKYSFHFFPKDPKLRKQWTLRVKRFVRDAVTGKVRMWQPKDYDVLCDRHFEENCFTLRTRLSKNNADIKYGGPQLEPDAVPTLFAYNSEKRKRQEEASANRRLTAAKRHKYEVLEELLKQSDKSDDLPPGAKNTHVSSYSEQHLEQKPRLISLLPPTTATVLTRDVTSQNSFKPDVASKMTGNIQIPYKGQLQANGQKQVSLLKTVHTGGTVRRRFMKSDVDSRSYTYYIIYKPFGEHDQPALDVDQEAVVNVVEEPAVYLVEEPDVYLVEEPAVDVVKEPAVYIGEELAIDVVKEPADYCMTQYCDQGRKADHVSDPINDDEDSGSYDLLRVKFEPAVDVVEEPAVHIGEELAIDVVEEPADYCMTQYCDQRRKPDEDSGSYDLLRVKFEVDQEQGSDRADLSPATDTGGVLQMCEIKREPETNCAADEVRGSAEELQFKVKRERDADTVDTDQTPAVDGVPLVSGIKTELETDFVDVRPLPASTDFCRKPGTRSEMTDKIAIEALGDTVQIKVERSSSSLDGSTDKNTDVCLCEAGVLRPFCNFHQDSARQDKSPSSTATGYGGTGKGCLGPYMNNMEQGHLASAPSACGVGQSLTLRKYHQASLYTTQAKQLNRVDASAGEVTGTEENEETKRDFRRSLDRLYQMLQNHPRELLDSAQAFNERMKQLKTVTAVSSALFQFGK